jgi:hypothetical protein
MPGRSKSSSKQLNPFSVACGLAWQRVDNFLPFYLVCQRNGSFTHHVDLTLYAYDTAIITMFGKPALLFSYLDSYLTYLE